MFRLVIACVHCQKAFSGSISQLAAEISCPHCQRSVPFPNTPRSEPLWAIAKNKQKIGPFNRAHLAELVATGQLAPADMVLLKGATKWETANSVPGLFPAPADEKMPKLVADDSTKFSEDIFSAVGTPTPHGPLSIKGIKVRLNFSLTLGDFQIFRKLGAGGMGAVYLAHQRTLGRLVALKVLSDSLADKETFVNRFLREATILAGLDHPNIVNFLGGGQEKNIPFFAMEFVEGFSVAALIKQRGKLSVGDALYIIAQAADGLGYAYAHKIVHRDIKPENIMINGQGQVKITDLGLGKLLDDRDLDLTDSGTVLGSPKYMAPEQSRNAKQADHRSDIYGLGGVLYFLLTAEQPFKGATAVELLLAKEQKSYPPARRTNDEVPARLDLLIDKMLAKEPKYRYQTYAELIRDLQGLGLTNAHFSFDPALVAPLGQLQPSSDLVEILFIDDDFDNARLAKQALEEGEIPSNLVVVKDGAEARALLRREGKFLFAPSPGLIIFGSSLHLADSLLTLQEIKVNDTLCHIPVVLLANSAETGRFFESHGYQVHVMVNIPSDPGQFRSLFSAVQGLCLTVIELKSQS